MFSKSLMLLPNWVALAPLQPHIQPLLSLANKHIVKKLDRAV